jgi:hypothetical protein
VGKPVHHIGVHFASDIFLGRRRRVGVQPNPETHHRIGEAVALLPRHDEIDVFEPG